MFQKIIFVFFILLLLGGCSNNSINIDDIKPLYSDKILKLSHDNECSYTTLLDWKQTNKVNDTTFWVSGQVYVDFIDKDKTQFLNQIISDSGINIYVKKYKKDSLSVRAVIKDAHHNVKKQIALIKSSLKILDSIRVGNLKKGKQGVYFELTSAASQPKLYTSYSKLQKDKYNFLGWLRLAFIDLKRYSFSELKAMASGKIEQISLRDANANIYRFSNNDTNAKFGLKCYTIDIFGDRVQDSIRLLNVHTSYNFEKDRWKVDSLTYFKESISEDFEILAEAALMVRIIVYVLAVCIGFSILMAIFNQIFGSTSSTSETNEVESKNEKK